MTTNPTISFVAEGDGGRPLIVGDPMLPKGQRTVNRYFNIAAFAEPMPLTAAGCASGTWQAVSWVNVGNQFKAAGVNTRSSTGNITSARDPRIMQSAMRLNF